jgi:hypothetical protein
MNLVNKINQIHHSFNKFKKVIFTSNSIENVSIPLWTHAINNVKFDFIWVKDKKESLINVKFGFIWVKDKDIFIQNKKDNLHLSNGTK